MNSDVPKLIINALPKEVIVVESKIQFEFMDFSKLGYGKEICGEMEIPEIGAVW
jgi:hypothetical protein